MSGRRSTVRATVLITAKDEAPRIGRALRSILDQDVSDIDVLVVDDGSADDTYAVAASFDSVRVVRSPGGGHVGALNHGVQMAKGELIVKCDADDWHLPGSIEALLSPLETDPSIDVVAGGSLCVDGDRVIELIVPMPSADHMMLVAMVMCPIEHTACAYRRSAVLAIGGYRTEGRVHATQDNDLWLRLLAAGHRFVGVAEPLAVHTITRTSVTARSFEAGHDRARRARVDFRRQYADELCTISNIRRQGRGVVGWCATPHPRLPDGFSGPGLAGAGTAVSDTFSYILGRLVHLALVDHAYRRAGATFVGGLSLGPAAVARGALRVGRRRASNRRVRGWFGPSDVARFLLGR